MSEKIYHIGICGAKGVGKESLMVSLRGWEFGKYVKGMCHPNRPYSQMSNYKGKDVNTHIHIIRDYINCPTGLDYVVLMFDCTSEQSIKELTPIYNAVRAKNPNAYYSLFGNKCDLPDNVYTYHKMRHGFYNGQNFYGSLALFFFSCKTGMRYQMHNDGNLKSYTHGGNQYQTLMECFLANIVQIDKTEIEKKVDEFDYEMTEFTDSITNFIADKMCDYTTEKVLPLYKKTLELKVENEKLLSEKNDAVITLQKVQLEKDELQEKYDVLKSSLDGLRNSLTNLMKND